VFVYQRHVHFEDVDAAQIVFFGRFLNYCHEAMEAMMAPLDGGYAGLIVGRRIGFPAVRVECDFEAPLRFGDRFKVHVTVEHVGNTSITFRYEFFGLPDDRVIARIRHVIVTTDLTVLKKVKIPDDVRALVEKHMPKGPISSSNL
jgi:4-hydroxybenzoyl-CoA thioesterase